MANIYVSTTGNDTTGNGSQSTPYATIQKAHDVSVAGDVIIIRGGTYAGVVITRDGTSGSKITYRNFTGENVIVDGNIDARKNVIYLNAANHITLTTSGGSFTVTHAVGSTVSAADAPACILVDNSTNYLIDGLIITRSATGTWADGTAKGGFGVLATNSSGTIQNCDISRHGSGVRVITVSGETFIQDNEIHHCDRMLRNDSSTSGDTGAQGIAVRETTRAGAWTRVLRNFVHDCIATSFDYGFDGGGCELFKAANVEIAYNQFRDTKVASETGGGAGYITGPQYVHHNEVWRTTTGAQGVENGSTNIMAGFNFRTGENSIYANNSFYNLNNWGCFTIESGDGLGTSFSGPIDGSLIANNAAQDCVQFMSINNTLDASVIIDDNIVDNTRTWGKWIGTAKSTLTAWQTSTPYDDNSIYAEPGFTTLSDSPDFTLQAGAPAINQGRVISGITDGYVGALPDMGANEFGSGAGGPTVVSGSFTANAVLQTSGGGGAPGTLPTYEAAGTAQSGSVDTGFWVDLPYPSGIVAGNLLLAQIHTRGTVAGAQITLVKPSGWEWVPGTGHDAVGGTSSARQSIFYKIATGTESGTVRFALTTGAAAPIIGRMFRFAGNGPGAPFESVVESTGTGTSISMPTTTTADDNRLAVAFKTVAANTTVSAPTGETGGDWVEPIAEFATTDGSGGVIAIFTAAKLTAGTISGGTSTHGSAAGSIVQAFAITPTSTLNTVSGSFTAQAILKKTIADVFDSDAVVKGPINKTFLASSVIKKLDNAGTFTANASVAGAVGFSFTANSVLKATLANARNMDAWLSASRTGTFTADAFILDVGSPTWTTPLNATSALVTSPFVFLIPTSPSNIHFHMQFDTVGTFDSVNLRNYKTNESQTGWEYWNGSAWTAFPSGGVSTTYIGNEARFLPPVPLTNVVWYRRIRAGF
jgi:hypothetical protein